MTDPTNVLQRERGDCFDDGYLPALLAQLSDALAQRLRPEAVTVVVGELTNAVTTEVLEAQRQSVHCAHVTEHGTAIERVARQQSLVTEMCELLALPDEFTTTQAARGLHTSTDTIARRIDAGQLVARRTGGGHARVAIETVIELRVAALRDAWTKDAAEGVAAGIHAAHATPTAEGASL